MHFVAIGAPQGVFQVAKRSGIILPVITAEYNDHLIQRLLTEKTVSIDTTASGGNTSLMTLVEDEDEVTTQP